MPTWESSTGLPTGLNRMSVVMLVGLVLELTTWVVVVVAVVVLAVVVVAMVVVATVVVVAMMVTLPQ